MPVPSRKLTPDEQAVIDILLQRHRGRFRAITKDNLSRVTGLKERVLRKVIKALIEHHNFRIGSTPESPAGYFIIQTAEEAKECTERLYKQGLSIFARVKVLRGLTTGEFGQQLKLDLHKQEKGTILL